MKASKEKRLGAGRVAFLARRDVFREKIEAGHTMATVYEEYEKQLGISYSQFVHYVNRYIRSKPDGDKPGIEATNKEPVKKPEYGQPKFKRTENRDDLFKPKPKE